jgi:hypothetical protein
MSEHHSALIDLDSKLMRARLEVAIEALLPFAPELAATALPQTFRQRSLEDWILKTEHLIATGVHERYPQHSRQHAHALAGILSDSGPDADLDIERIEQRTRQFMGAAADDEAVLDLGDGLRLRKKRRGDGNRVEDWSAIDALATLSEPEVQALCSGHPFRQAACAYRLGRFAECCDALNRCLDEDDDVEEYWYLLAFSARHLGQFDVFESIVFENRRQRPG